MIDHRRTSWAASLPAAVATLGIALAATLWPLPGLAEVSVTGAESSPMLRLEVMSVVDDPDPFSGLVWLRYRADSASRAVLNDAGLSNGDGRPSALLTKNGTPLVAWARNSAGGYDLVVSRYENGAWTAPEVLAGGPLDELDPHLFVDPTDDRVHVVYWIDDATPRVMHREAATDLSTWSVPVQVSQVTEPACRPHGVVHNGLMRVAYEIHDFGIGTTPRQIVLATRNGQTFLSQMLSVTFHDGPNRPQVHSVSGRLWVDWIDAGDEMAWMSLISGGWGEVRVEGFQSQEELDYHVRGKIESLALD